MKAFGVALYEWRESRGLEAHRFLHHGPLAAKDLRAVESGTAGWTPLLLHQLGYTVMRAAGLELDEEGDQVMAAVQALAAHINDGTLRRSLLDGAALALQSLD